VGCKLGQVGSLRMRLSKLTAVLFLGKEINVRLPSDYTWHGETCFRHKASRAVLSQKSARDREKSVCPPPPILHLIHPLLQKGKNRHQKNKFLIFAFVWSNEKYLRLKLCHSSIGPLLNHVPGRLPLLPSPWYRLDGITCLSPLGVLNTQTNK
jgi:hypothetical protein